MTGYQEWLYWNYVTSIFTFKSWSSASSDTWILSLTQHVHITTHLCLTAIIRKECRETYAEENRLACFRVQKVVDHVLDALLWMFFCSKFDSWFLIFKVAGWWLRNILQIEEPFPESLSTANNVNLIIECHKFVHSHWKQLKVTSVYYSNSAIYADPESLILLHLIRTDAVSLF